MNKLQNILLVGAFAVFVLGLTYTASAEYSSGDVVKPLLFPVDTGDGATPNMLQFDTYESDVQGALATCAMTPNGTSDATLEVPEEPHPVYQQPPYYEPNLSAPIRPVAMRNTPYNPNRPYNPYNPPGDDDDDDPPGDDDDDDPPTTPEPATLLILGMGLAGLAAVARRRNRK